MAKQSAKSCDSQHSGGKTSICVHCNNMGKVNGEILVAYDPDNNKPLVEKYTCKYCGHIENLITPHNLILTQAQWNTYMAM